MNENEQIEALYKDLNKVVVRYSAEFQIPVTAAIGCLELLKSRLINTTEWEWEDGE